MHFFFFLCFDGHRVLHSFPTRRSSDLTFALPRVPASCRRTHSLSIRRALMVRSEEHTSELQSLRHLVCRLLLEKKKFENQKELTKMQLDNQKEIAEMQNETKQ